LAINKLSVEKFYQVNQSSTTDALSSSRWQSFLFFELRSHR